MITTTVSAGTVRLRITIAAGTVGKALTITAAATGRAARTLRGWRDVPAPAIAVAVDHEAELNLPVRYAVLIDGVEVESVTLTVDAPLPILVDPIRGNPLEVIIQEWPAEDYERTGHEVTVAGSSAPVIIDGIETSARSSITLIHPPSGSTADQLADALRAGSRLRIRPACPDLPTVWASARGRRRRRFSTAPGSAIVDEIELRHTAQPAPDTAAVGNTLGDLHAAVPTTLAAIAARWPGVLADIAFEDLTA